MATDIAWVLNNNPKYEGCAWFLTDDKSLENLNWGSTKDENDNSIPKPKEWGATILICILFRIHTQ